MPKKSKKKLGVIAGVAAAVIVVAGAGFWVWHETPGFCGAICHTPMDPYLDTYEQDYNAEGVDKWGNAVENTKGMMVVSHKMVLDDSGESLDCLSCHIPTMSEQISEGIAWVTGGYDVVDNPTYELVLHETSLEDLTAARGVEPDSFCMNEACHTGADGAAMTREELVEATAGLTRNPHEMPHGDLLCSDCHKAHRASVNYCTSCHSDAPVSDGWISVIEEKQLAASA
ncbi:MAG: cytochrome c3 family protein [Eggerthellaceae bacterium]|nr:cytochrome c3 family protein [Eggerthellaceae bacterium]